MKNTPLRMCAVCRQSKPKSEMIRVVRTPEGSFVLDKAGKAQGRGAYICGAECLKTGIRKKLLNKSFKTALPEEIYENLTKLASEY